METETTVVANNQEGEHTSPEVPAESDPNAQNPGEQAPQTPPEGEKPATDEQPGKRAESRRFERRLSAAYRREAEAKARAEQLERRLQELEAKASQPKTGEPKLEDFSDIEEYAKAKADFEADKRLKEREAQERQAKAREYQERVAGGWRERVAKADEKYDDFDEVVGDLQPTSHAIVAIMLAENGPDVAYHLAKNPAQAQRIRDLDPLSQAIEIGKLSAKLASEPSKPKTPSKAPAPIAPVNGGGGAANDMPSDKDDIDTWMRKENERMKKR